MDTPFPGQRVIYTVRKTGGNHKGGTRVTGQKEIPATVLRVGTSGRDYIQMTNGVNTRKAWVFRRNLRPAPPLDPKENT